MSENQQGQIPELTNLPTRQLFKRDKHLKGDIPTYWGPKQDSSPEGEKYQPPGDWPKEKTLVRVPRVARWFWEIMELKTEVIIVSGVTGSYSFGHHTNFFDEDIVSSSPNVIPGHIHTALPAGGGVEFYGLLSTTTISGFTSIDLGDGDVLTFTASGSSKDWLTAFPSPPFKLEDYEDRSSPTYLGAKATWDILIGKFSPPKPVIVNAIPPLTFLADQPQAVGITPPIPTGAYEVNGVGYGQSFNYGDYAVNIPDGWAQPPNLKTPTQLDSMILIESGFKGLYSTSTNPYFDSFRKNFDMVNFLDMVTPQEPGFFATHTVNFITLTSFHTPIDLNDGRIFKIREAYKSFPTYVVVILIDQDSFGDLLAIPSPLAQIYLDEVTALVGILADCGWFIENVKYTDPETTRLVIDKYIKTYLKPELEDAPPEE